MFEKVIRLNKREVRICIFSSPVLETEKAAVFGFPLTIHRELLELTSEEFGNSVKGSWLKIDWDSNEIRILSDILGGFRVYYYSDDNNITITDDYEYLIQNSGIVTEKHHEEYQYWEKHKYTSGSATLIKGINKVSPATEFEITEQGCFERSYFKDFNRNSDISKHIASVNNDLNDTFEKLKQCSEKVVLLFSGGKDSCLLLQYLIKYEIEFIPVFFKLNPITKHGVEDLVKVRKVSKELGLELEEIEIELNKIPEDFSLEIVKRQLFDRHFSILHYWGTKILVEKFGTNIYLVNGQGSDNILSFGPSETSLMSFFRRNIMYNPKTLISNIGLILLTLKTGKLFRFPLNEEDRLYALFDDFKYTRVIELKINKAYLDYFYSYIRRQTKKFESFYSKEMFCRILSYLQGSDNQVVVNSARFNGVKVLMPFATPEIIYGTVRFKNENLEIRKPKYAIDQILLDKFHFNYKVLLSRRANKKNKIKEKFVKHIPNTDGSEMYANVFNEILTKYYR